MLTADYDDLRARAKAKVHSAGAQIDDVALDAVLVTVTPLMDRLIAEREAAAMAAPGSRANEWAVNIDWYRQGHRAALSVLRTDMADLRGQGFAEGKTYEDALRQVWDLINSLDSVSNRIQLDPGTFAKPSHLRQVAATLKDRAFQAALVFPGDWERVNEIFEDMKEGPDFITNGQVNEEGPVKVTGHLNPEVARFLTLVQPYTAMLVADIIDLEARLHADDPCWAQGEDPLCDLYPFVAMLAEQIYQVYGKNA